MLFKSAEQYITEPYADQARKLDTVPQAISVSPYHLARLFRKLRGTTFLHHYTGYASAKRFRTVFKREMGCAPSEYRRNRWGPRV